MTITDLDDARSYAIRKRYLIARFHISDDVPDLLDAIRERDAEIERLRAIVERFLDITDADAMRQLSQEVGSEWVKR